MSKTDLRARPMFHRTRDAIEAHLTIVFTALAVSREVQARTGLAILMGEPPESVWEPVPVDPPFRWTGS